VVVVGNVIVISAIELVVLVTPIAVELLVASATLIVVLSICGEFVASFADSSISSVGWFSFCVEPAVMLCDGPDSKYVSDDF
jgi:hypothetical protein